MKISQIIKLFFIMIIFSDSTGYAKMSDRLHTIYSDSLQEKRTYQVYLPESYNNKQLQKASYPVLYILDANIRFEEAITITELLHKTYHTIPEMIIVGIHNTDRTRDLTPTQDLAERNGRTFPNSGGAQNFQNFLVNELRNKINEDYRTNGYNLLSGHSFGGLFALDLLLKTPDAFNTYIVADPSLWWDNSIIRKTITYSLVLQHENQIKVIFQGNSKKQTTAKNS